jgi:hypothetical protein
MISKMNNDNLISNESTNTISMRNENFWLNIKLKVKKYLHYFKPNLVNILLTFITFLLLIIITRKLGLTFIITFISYLLFAILVSPFLEKNFLSKFNFISSKKETTSLLKSTSNKILFFSNNKYLRGLSLLKLEWTANIAYLNRMWDFLMEENLQLQDCKEGCFIIIKKKIQIIKTKNLQEAVFELTKEIEKTALLIKKKFEMEYDFFQIKLVKGQENILTILNLGQSIDKFNQIPELSEDDFEDIREESKEMIGV